MLHKLKTWNPYFSDIVKGKKTFEIRKNDRDFKIGDELLLEEYDQTTNEYTKRTCLCKVDYIIKGGKLGLEEGFVIMGIIKS